MSDPFTLRIFVPSGDPEGVRVVDWTGRGYIVPRDRWAEVKSRPEISQAGVYVLMGYEPDELGNDRPVIYIGQTDNLKIVSEIMISTRNFGRRRRSSCLETMA